MTSIIKVTPLLGALDTGTAICYLLKVDQFTLLLDCGLDVTKLSEFTARIMQHINNIDAVLVSYPDVDHIGALPYLYGTLGLDCPIYGTVPVHNMGQMFLYDYYQSKNSSEDFNIFTLDHVDNVFDHFQQMKYSQTFTICPGIAITPYAAGHMIGGTMWKILKDDEEDIVYAVDFNHKKERHLNGALFNNIIRPSLLITDAYNATFEYKKRRKRDQELISTILETVRQDGNVIIVVDTAGRVLELMQLLEQLWRNAESGLSAYSLALLNHVGYNVVDFAKNMLEWMSDTVTKQFEEQRSYPFHFKHLNLCHSLQELEKIPSPYVLLTSMADLSCGFARNLLAVSAESKENCIIVTQRTKPDTLASRLLSNTINNTIDITIGKRVPLEGKELEDHFASIAKKQQESEKMEVVEEGEETDEEQEDDQVLVQRHDVPIPEETHSKKSFFKQHKVYPMFPFHEEKLKWDEYGEFIKHDHFRIEEEPMKEEEMETEKAKPVPAVPAAREIPTKCVTSRIKTQVNCKVKFIDFEGRSDGESIKRILAAVLKPRQMVIVHGTPDSSRHLAEFCRDSKDMGVSQIFVPGIGETVDATSERHIYQVKLKDALVTAAKFSRANDAELAWIDAVIDVQLNAEKEEVAMLEPLTNKPSHVPVFINEPRLSNLRQTLIKSGIQAEFNGGVLVCNNKVAIRRNASGTIQIEGTVCDDYYKIRSLLYSMYAII